MLLSGPVHCSFATYILDKEVCLHYIKLTCVDLNVTHTSSLLSGSHYNEVAF
jgi:hypothetical protein